MAKVIIIEDDQKLQVLYQAALKFQGYDVFMANSVTNAKSLPELKTAQLILVDSNCFDFGSLEKGAFSAPLFLLTSLPEKESATLAAKVGAKFFLNPLDGSLGLLIKEARKILG